VDYAEGGAPKVDALSDAWSNCRVGYDDENTINPLYPLILSFSLKEKELSNVNKHLMLKKDF